MNLDAFVYQVEDMKIDPRYKETLRETHKELLNVVREKDLEMASIIEDKKLISTDHELANRELDWVKNQNELLKNEIADLKEANEILKLNENTQEEAHKKYYTE